MEIETTIDRTEANTCFSSSYGNRTAINQRSGLKSTANHVSGDGFFVPRVGSDTCLTLLPLTNPDERGGVQVSTPDATLEIPYFTSWDLC